MIFKLSVIFVFSVLAVSCSDLNRSLGLPPEGVLNFIPKDESTAEERARIDSTLTKIESMAKEFGYNGNFRKLPIIVTTEDVQKNDRVGYCKWDDSGLGEFITINREVFTKDRYYSSRADYVFKVLLHEIGHCYFRRGHDSAVLEKEGYNIIVEVVDDLGGGDFIFDKLPVSIMYASSQQISAQLSSVPLTLQKYFVSEILGLAKMKSVEELLAIPGVKFVQRTNED